jgi:hypothetical protein
MEKQQPQQPNFFNVSGVYLLARVLSLTVTPLLRTNFGLEAFGWPGLFTACLLILVAGQTGSPLLAAYWWLWLGALLVQRCKSYQLSRRGQAPHSQFQGTPWVTLALFPMRRINQAKWVEAGLVGAAGLLLGLAAQDLPELIDSRFAGLLLWAAFGLFVARVIEYQHNRAHARRARDAQIEMQANARFYRGEADDF